MKRLTGIDSVIKIIGLIFCGLFIFTMLHDAQLYFSSDSLASDIIVQKIMSTGNAPINDYVAQQTFWQLHVLFWLPKLLLNFIIPNTILVDKIYVALLYVMLLLLTYLVSAKLCGKGAGGIALCFLGCGISITWIVCSAIEIAYTIHLILMLVFLWLNAYLIEVAGNRYAKRQYLILLGLSIFIIYIISIDQRYAAIFVAPFCVAQVVVNYTECYKVTSAKELDKKFVLNNLFLLGVLLGSTLIGLIINKQLKQVLPFSERLTALSLFQFADLQNFFSAFSLHILGILQLWGCDLSPSVSTISLTSIGYIIKGIACITCMIIVPILSAINYRDLPRSIKYLLLFYLTMVAELFYIYVLSSLNYVSNSRYFLYEVILAIMLSAWYFYEKLIKPHNLNRYLVIMGVLVFCLCSQISIMKDIKNKNEIGDYQRKKQLISVLEENHLSYGYATYWNAQILTSMSNTEVKVLPIVVTETIDPFYDINYIGAFASANHSGDTFLLLTKQEYETIVSNDSNTVFEELGEPEKMIEADEYMICLYDYNIADRLYRFPYNEGYVPLKGSYKISQNILTESCCVLNGTETLNVTCFPVEIQPNSYYILRFWGETEAASSMFYVDFCGGNYDFAGQDKAIDLQAGNNLYEVIIPSGDMIDANNVKLRFVGEPEASVTLTDINLALLDVG